jgi:NADP-dependent 3-hydroxy acid dehydrogenase YdfG
MQPANRRVLVTGASGAIGSATARRLVADGARVVVSGRNLAALSALARELGGPPVAEVVVADLRDRYAVDALAQRCRTLDALVLNAGVQAEDDLTGDDPPGLVDEVLDTNLRAPIHLALPFVSHHLATNTPGALVFVGSVAGVVASPGLRLYNATKFGVRGFALSLAQDLHDTPVHCTHLAPGYVRNAGMFANSGAALPPGVRTSTPGEVADAIVSALRRGPTEAFVAPTEVRVAASAAGLLPAVGAALQRRFGASARLPAPGERPAS